MNDGEFTESKKNSKESFYAFYYAFFCWMLLLFVILSEYFMRLAFGIAFWVKCSYFQFDKGILGTAWVISSIRKNAARQGGSVMNKWNICIFRSHRVLNYSFFSYFTSPHFSVYERKSIFFTNCASFFLLLLCCVVISSLVFLFLLKNTCSSWNRIRIVARKAKHEWNDNHNKVLIIITRQSWASYKLHINGPALCFALVFR